MRLLIALVWVSAAIAAGCKGSRNASASGTSTPTPPADTAQAQRGPGRGPNMNARPDTLVWMREGGCHGTCPIYHLVLYVDGHVHYTGKRFTDLIGTYRKELTGAQLDEVKRILRQADLGQFQPQYGQSGNDFPSFHLIAKLDARRTQIDVYENRPAAFDSLFVRLRTTIGISAGYTRVEGGE